MELKENVCAFKYAEKLEKLGVKQDSLFYWVKDPEAKLEMIFKNDEGIFEWETDDYVPTVVDILHNKKWSDWKDDDAKEIYSAFTVAELGAQLPMQITFQDKLYFFMAWKRKNGFAVIYKPNEGRNYFPAQFAIKEADARAKMRIYLIEHKLV